MANVLDDEYFDGRGVRSDIAFTYPWREWMDGRTRELIQNEDFFTVPRDLVRQARRAARAKNMRVQTETTKTTVTLRFLPKEPTT